jgi:hypothetical protein
VVCCHLRKPTNAEPSGGRRGRATHRKEKLARSVSRLAIGFAATGALGSFFAAPLRLSPNRRDGVSRAHQKDYEFLTQLRTENVSVSVDKSRIQADSNATIEKLRTEKDPTKRRELLVAVRILIAALEKL